MPSDIFWALVTGIIIGTGISAVFPLRERPIAGEAEAEEARNHLANRLGIDPELVTVTQVWEVGLTQEGAEAFTRKHGVDVTAIAEEPSGGVYHA